MTDPAHITHGAAVSAPSGVGGSLPSRAVQSACHVLNFAASFFLGPGARFLCLIREIELLVAGPACQDAAALLQQAVFCLRGAYRADVMQGACAPGPVDGVTGLRVVHVVFVEECRKAAAPLQMLHAGFEHADLFSQFRNPVPQLHNIHERFDG